MRFVAQQLGFNFVLFLLLSHAGLAKSPELPLTIALVGPMSKDMTALGQRVIQSVSFHINQFNTLRDKNRQIELLTYDDEGNPEKAEKVAELIKAEGKVSVIIANFLYESASRMIEIYRRLEIPILTPSILREENFNSPWLYRTLFNSHVEGVFLASYMKKVSEYKTVNIIHTDDDYGRTSARDFSSPFTSMGGLIRHEWQVHVASLEADLFNITNQLLAEQHNPADVIFLATDAKISAEIIAFLKRSGLAYKMFGTHLITDLDFIKFISLYPEEEANPGFFSNGTLGLSPIILDIGNEQAQIFKKQYTDFYRSTPGWFEASFFDTSLVASKAIVHAINHSTISSVTDLRQAVKSYLHKIDNPSQAIHGITGSIYFDKNQERVAHIMVGEFFNQKLNSTYSQLYPVDNPQLLSVKDIDNKNIITANNQYLQKTDIVFTDVDIIEVSDLDVKTSDYVINFYLSFRYRGDVDAKNIDFINKAEPIILGQPFEKTIKNGVTQESYRIEAKFNNPFIFTKYPFDKQELLLKFENKNGFNNNIIYVRDEVSMSLESLESDLEQIQKSKSLEDWTATNVIFFQDIVEHSFAFNNPRFLESDNKIRYSRFNVKITIQRNPLSFALKNFLPLLIMFLLIYLVTYTDFSTSISVFIGAILATIIEHFRISGDLIGIGYIIALDYLFYATYIIIVMQITIAIVAENLRRKNREKLSQKILTMDKIVFPFVVLSIISIYVYSSLHVEKPQALQAKIIPASPQTDQIKPPGKTILTLSSWNRESHEEMDKIIAVFNAKQSDFSVQFIPIKHSQYYKALLTELETGNKPDLFYLPGNEIESQFLIKNGHTLPLTNIKLNHTLSSEEKRLWTNNKGILEGAPLQAVSQAVYYNQDIFHKLKIAVPTTWQEFIKVAQKIKAMGIIPISNGSKDVSVNAEIIFMGIAPNFIGGAEGRAMFEKGQRCFDDETVLKSFMAIKELVPFLPKDHSQLTRYDSRELFIEQKAAMWLAESSELTFFAKEKPKFSYSIFALPASLGHKTTLIYQYDSALAINPRSEHKEYALAFLLWTQSKEYAQLLQKHLPGYFSLASTHIPLTDAHAREFWRLIKSNKTDSRWILPPGLPSSYQLMARATNEVLNGRMSPKEAAASLQRGLATWFRPAQLCR